MSGIDARVASRAAATLITAFVVIGGASALVLPHSTFEDWGFLIGPAAWIVGALLASKAAGLGVREAVLGSLAAVVPNALAGILGLHWAGVAIGVVAFALACGWFAARSRAPAAG